MSVIWSGITEEGAVVPVQVDETGKVIATTSGPEGDYVKKTGDNMTGDLTLGPTDSTQISLGATGSLLLGGTLPEDPAITLQGSGGSLVCKGGIRAEGSIRSEIDLLSSEGNPQSGGSDGLRAESYGEVHLSRSEKQAGVGLRVFNIYTTGVSDATAFFRSDGSAVFKGKIEITNDDGGLANISLNPKGQVNFAKNACGFTAGGELFFTSRGDRYKLVVSNGLCQAEPYTLRSALEEKAEDFISDKRETKPSDPALEAQGGMTMDIDNSSPKRD